MFGDSSLAGIILLPMLMAGVLFALRRHPRLSRGIGLLSTGCGTFYTGHLAHRALTGAPIALAVGNWKIPLGIGLVVDGLSGLILTATWGIVTLLLLHEALTDHSKAPVERLPLIQFLLMGLSFSFCTGDLFNLFVAFEITLMASYSLLSSESEQPRRAVYPYLLLNILGSALFLCAAGLAYNLYGSLNFADMAQRTPALLENPAFATRLPLLKMMLLVAFGLKAGMIPFHAWLPLSYPTLPPVIAALFSALLTKLGIYTLLRVTTSLFPGDPDFIKQIFIGLGGLTLVLGGLGALARTSWRAILSFHIISQVGYMVLGIGLMSEASRTGTMAFLIHNILVKSALFLVGDAVLAQSGSDELSQTGGFWKAHPFRSLVFGVLAASLSGLPPLTGFWSKLILLNSLDERDSPFVFLVILSGGILTGLSMMKIWLATFWSPAPESKPLRPASWQSWLVPTFLALIALGLGIQGRSFVRLAQAASHSLESHELYQNTVLPLGTRGVSEP